MLYWCLQKYTNISLTLLVIWFHYCKVIVSSSYQLSWQITPTFPHFLRSMQYGFTSSIFVTPCSIRRQKPPTVMVKLTSTHQHTSHQTLDQQILGMFGAGGLLPGFSGFYFRSSDTCLLVNIGSRQFLAYLVILPNLGLDQFSLS